MDASSNYCVRGTVPDDIKYASSITGALALSAAKRGTGIAPRPIELIEKKIAEGLAVIAINKESGDWVGFCYLEVWHHEKYIANSGLIVLPEYRGSGIAREIKVELMQISRMRFSSSTVVSITGSAEVMHINREMGYQEVSFAGLLEDYYFINGADSWVDYPSLIHKTSSGKAYKAMVLNLFEEPGLAWGATG